MAATTPMTLRIDPELKTAAEQAAAAAGTTLTDFVVNAMKQATHPLCETCGRASPAAVIAPGFSDAFTDFYNTRCKVGPNEPFAVFTLEGVTPKVYWCRLVASHLLEPSAGTIVVDALFERVPFGSGLIAGDARLQISIPRGFIQGWESDPEGHLYVAQRTLGYRDGNESARNLYSSMVARGVIAPPGGPQR